MLQIEAIKTYMDAWELKAKEYYTKIKEEYDEAVKNTPEGFYTVNGYKFLHSASRDQKFISKYGKGTMQIIRWQFYDIDNIIHKERESKETALISKVEKKSGKIIDASGLRVSNLNGQINGLIKGELKTVKVETIDAGGYNIQCYHFRVLVKEV